MSFLDRARERALAASQQVRAVASQVTSGVTEGSPPELAPDDEPQEIGADPAATSTASGATNAMPAPSTREAMQRSLDAARTGLAGLVDRLDPRLVADVIIKATSLQERANVALREKGSAYRIDGISITATIPPQISFSIGRSGSSEEL